MPHIRFRGITEEHSAVLSQRLSEGLSDRVGVPVDHFTYEHVATRFYFDGQEGGAYPFVEVFWFDRGQSVKDEVAKFITETILHIGYKGDVAVVFMPLEPANYFENGQHF